MQNRLILTAIVVREEALRYTPAGVPVLEIWLRHQSQQQEANVNRTVRCEIQAMMVGETARYFAGKLLNIHLSVAGFLCQRGLRNPQLILHIEHAEFVKGEIHGSSALQT